MKQMKRTEVKKLRDTDYYYSDSQSGNGSKQINDVVEVEFVGSINDLKFSKHAWKERYDRLNHDNRRYEGNVVKCYIDEYYEYPGVYRAYLVLEDGTVLVCHYERDEKNVIRRFDVLTVLLESWLTFNIVDEEMEYKPKVISTDFLLTNTLEGSNTIKKKIYQRKQVEKKKNYYEMANQLRNKK